MEIRFALNMKPRVASSVVSSWERLFDGDDDDVDDDYAKKIFNIQKMSSFGLLGTMKKNTASDCVVTTSVQIGIEWNTKKLGRM